MYHPITFHIVFVHLEKFTSVCVRVGLRLNRSWDERLNILSDRVLVVAARSSCPVRSLLLTIPSTLDVTTHIVLTLRLSSSFPSNNACSSVLRPILIMTKENKLLLLMSAITDMSSSAELVSVEWCYN